MSHTHVKAPFSQQQVVALWHYQFGEGKWAVDAMHPFTCPHRHDHPEIGRDTGILIPTINGWICLFCDYTQNWAHHFMTE